MIQSQVLELEFEPQRLDRVAAPIGRSVIDHDDFKLVGAQRLALQGGQSLEEQIPPIARRDADGRPQLISLLQGVQGSE
jgi:hypothetical protein